MGLILQRGQTVFADTVTFIYYFENHEVYADRLDRLFQSFADLNVQIVTSMVTYIEVLTLPEKNGNHRLAAKYRDYLTNSENLSVYPLDFQVADEAVRLRAKHGLRTPDAIQLATARVCGADVVLTNDQRWRIVPNMPVVLMDEV